MPASFAAKSAEGMGKTNPGQGWEMGLQSAQLDCALSDPQSVVRDRGKTYFMYRTQK